MRPVDGGRLLGRRGVVCRGPGNYHLVRHWEVVNPRYEAPVQIYAAPETRSARDYRVVRSARSS